MFHFKSGDLIECLESFGTVSRRTFVNEGDLNEYVKVATVSVLSINRIFPKGSVWTVLDSGKISVCLSVTRNRDFYPGYKLLGQNGSDPCVVFALMEDNNYMAAPRFKKVS